MAGNHVLTINYNGNGTNVSNVPSSNSVSHQNKVGTYPFIVSIALGSAPSRYGFTFNGWSTSPTASSGYAAGGNYAYAFSSESETTKTIAMYATWSHTNVYVDFNANGGTGAPSKYWHWQGYSTTLPSTVPTRAGYTFLGWSQSATATAASYQPGGTYALYNNVTLYAVWKRSTSSVSAANGSLGSALAISITRHNNSYTHALSYTFGNETGRIAQGVGTSYSWMPPLSLAAQFPSGTSGTCIITCETFDGDTSLGTSTVSITLSIPATVKCKISAVTLEETVSGLQSKFAGFVQMKSKIRVTATYDHSDCYGGTVSSIKITINGQVMTENGAVTSEITGSGTLSYQVEITDSRGRSFTYSGVYNVLALFVPSISIVAARDATTPSSIVINYDFSIASCNSHNDKTITVYYKTQSAQYYNRATEITPSAYSGSDSYTITGTDANAAYDIRVTIADYFQTITAETQVASTGNRIADVSYSDKTISWHGTNPEDGNDHQWKIENFHNGIIICGETIDAATIAAIIALINQ